MSIGGLGEAEETSCSGVVIDASGLTVVSYSALNPMDKISSAFKLRLGGEDSEAIKTKTELSRIQMRLPDGTELAARIVLKDKELDLAFVVPDPKEGEKAPTFTPVKLAGEPSVKEQDDVVALLRHGKELGYQPILLVGQVSSLIKKPHTFYDVSVTAQPGSAVFLPDGQLLGVTVVFSGSGGGGLFAAAGGMETLVLPASEIAKSAEQAKKAAAKKSADKEVKEEKPKAETGK
jgi:S1-C subfamily serine protease